VICDVLVVRGVPIKYLLDSLQVIGTFDTFDIISQKKEGI